MNAYTIHEVTTRAEMDSFTDLVWQGWGDPYMPSGRISRPIVGYTAADKVRAIADSKDRAWNAFTKSKDPNAKSERVWLFAKHVESGDMVGGIILSFAQGSAFPNGCPRVECPVWPEGEEVREFCEEMFRQASTPRSMWMQRPHGTVVNFVVHPKHRGRGVGRLLLDYNSNQLDVKGIEGFVEASELGRPAYEKAGFQVVMKVASYIPAGKSDDWLRWYHEMGIPAWYAMWRPKGGQVEPGERSKPWQLGPVIPID